MWEITIDERMAETSPFQTVMRVSFQIPGNKFPDLLDQHYQQ
jgi:hypothetical protein